MPTDEQREIFDKLTAKAKRAGMLKFNVDGVAVIELPRDEAGTAAASPQPTEGVKV